MSRRSRGGTESGDRGFTLTEIVVVLALMAIATSIAVVAIGSESSSGAQGACKSDFQAVQAATELYRQQTGIYPGAALPLGDSYTTQALAGNVPSGWDGAKYLLGTVATNGSTLGPWLKEEPLNSGHYEIAVRTSPSDGGLGVFSVTYPYAQIGSSGSVSDCTRL